MANAVATIKGTTDFVGKCCQVFLNLSYNRFTFGSTYKYEKY